MASRTTVEIVLKTVDRASRGLKNFLGMAGRGLMSLNGAIAGLTFGLITAKLFQVGTAFEETESKFRTVFGEWSDTLDEVATKWGRFAGLTRTQARDILGTAGQIGQSLGMQVRQSAAFAEEVIRTAGDIASFQNKKIQDVAHAMMSAMNGEREGLKLLAVGFNEAELQAEALNQTRKSSIDLVTAEEKALATLSLIQRKAGVQMGDLERTADSLANRWRRVRADLSGVVERLAVGLMPVFEEAVALIDDNTEAVEALARGFLKGTEYAVNFLQNIRMITAGFRELGAQARYAALQILDAIPGVEVSAGRWSEAAVALGEARAASARLVEEIHGEGSGGEPRAGIFDRLLGLGDPSGNGPAPDSETRAGEVLGGVVDQTEGLLKLAEAQARAGTKGLDVTERMGFRLREIETLQGRVNELIARRGELTNEELATLLETRAALDELAEAARTQTGQTGPKLGGRPNFVQDPREVSSIYGDREGSGVDLSGFGGDLLQVADAMGAFQELDELVNGSLATGFSALGDGISAAMTAAVTGSQRAGAAFAGAMLGALSSVAKGFGQFFLAQATGALGKAILGDPRGWAAAAKYGAAATAMFAVSGMAAGFAFGGSGGSYGGLTRDEFATSQDVQNSRGEATLVVEGGFLDMGDPRQADRLARALEELSGRRVTVVGG